ncbi:MAG TPA: FKBP-type peptidyl-prolyl cis-trans isomerase [Vicinamibacteria bacterium]|nr:FKBP-type peptidyl-prolyl cis-trans isomerase [Vicinamibacteria bacterium]
MESSTYTRARRPSAWLLAVGLTALGCGAGAQSGAGASPAPGALQTDEQKTVYALGLILGKNVEKLNLTPEELALVQKGLRDAASGQKPEVELEVYGPRVQELAQARMTAGAKVAQEKGQSILDQAAQEAGALKTPSGMVFRSLQAGTGASPAASDRVRVHYRGTLIDGTEFDSSIKRGEPAEFQLTGVIPCWTEGVQKMKVGEKARLVCPPGLAYGERGFPPSIPGGSTLVFEVELLDIVKK